MVVRFVGQTTKALLWFSESSSPIHLGLPHSSVGKESACSAGKCITELEQHLHAIPPTLAMNPQAQALRSLLEVVVLSRNSRDAIAALGLLQKVSVLNLFVLEDAKFVNIW